MVFAYLQNIATIVSDEKVYNDISYIFHYCKLIFYKLVPELEKHYIKLHSLLIASQLLIPLNLYDLVKSELVFEIKQYEIENLPKIYSFIKEGTLFDDVKDYLQLMVFDLL